MAYCFLGTTIGLAEHPVPVIAWHFASGALCWFYVHHGLQGPQEHFTKAQRDKYTAPNFILEDLELRADAAATTLGAQMQTWSKCIAWLVRFAPGLFPTCLTHKSHSITLIGSSATMRGMNARPRMVHGPVVLDLLNNYFCTSTGYNRTLNRIFETPPVEIPAHPQELNVPFCNRAKDIRNAAKIFQTWSIGFLWIYFLWIVQNVVPPVRDLTGRIPNQFGIKRKRRKKNPVVRRELRS